MQDQKKHVESLIAKAADAKDSGDAMRFSQAAQNAAASMCTLCTVLNLEQGLEEAAKAAHPPMTIDVGDSDERVRRMTNRFLMWRLPDDFCPDAGISFKAEFNEHTAHPMKHQPSGTNLFDERQAEAMVRHMLGDG